MPAIFPPLSCSWTDSRSRQVVVGGDESLHFGEVRHLWGNRARQLVLRYIHADQITREIHCDRRIKVARKPGQLHAHQIERQKSCVLKNTVPYENHDRCQIVRTLLA